MKFLKTLAWTSLILVSTTGCNLTLGPITETKAIIVNNGNTVEILENKKVSCHLYSESIEKEKNENKSINVFKQDIGGWIAMPPEHWIKIKQEYTDIKEENKLLKAKINR